MHKNAFWLLIGLVVVILWTECFGGESRFFRIRCLEGSTPENLAIVSDEFGQIFLEFDSLDLRSYIIESADSLGPPPRWTTVCSVIGDGQRVRWLATWQPITWIGLTGDDEAPPTVELPVASKTELSVSVSLPGILRQHVVQEGALYDLVRVPGCALTDAVGLPQLPVLAKYISIPPGCTATLQVTGCDEVTLPGYNVFPVQEPPIDRPNAPEPAFAKNEAFYRTGGPYPGVVAALASTGVIRGHDITMVQVYPVSFDPSNGCLVARKTIDLHVSFSAPDPAVKEARLRVRSELFDEFVSGLTLNFAAAEDEEGRIKKTNQRPLQEETGAQVLIITHPDLADAAQTLASWKAKVGYSTMVVQTTDINEAGPTADDIETYIENGYSNWTTPPDFLILLGDADLVPTHYETEHPGAGPNPGDDYPDGTQIGTDLYYVTVDGNDYFPDIAQGRIPVDNLEEASRVISKILEYERHPPPASEFYSNAVAMAYFQDSAPLDGYEDSTESLTVTVSEDDATVTLVREGELIGSGQSATGEAVFDFSPVLNATAPVEVTVSKPGFRPYEGVVNLPSAYRWSTSFGGSSHEWGFSVDQSSDGGYIVAGWTRSSGAGGHDMYLVNTDADGNESWSKTFGGTKNDWAFFVRQTSDGGYLLAGYTEDWSVGGGGRDAYIVKTDDEGNEDWNRKFGGGQLADARWASETPDGGYIVGGASDASGSSELYLFKMHLDPNKQWYKTFGAAPYSYAFNETADGGYVLATVESNNVCLMKTDAQGDVVMENTVQAPGNQLPTCVRQTSDGGYIVTGYTSTSDAGWDVFLMKAESQCNEAWTVTFGGDMDDEGHSVWQTSDGGYIVAGYTRSFDPIIGVYLIKTDENGDEDWSNVIGEGATFAEMGESVQQTPDGGYIIAGYTENLASGPTDMYLAKTDREGNVSPPQ